MRLICPIVLATLIFAVVVLAQDSANNEACGSWVYPHNPTYPSYTNISANVLATPNGYLFFVDNIPVMDNVLLNIPSQSITPRDSLPLQLDSISSGSSCKYNGPKLVCPPSGSIFSNPRFKYTMGADRKGCKTMNVNWLISPEEAMTLGTIRRERIGDTWHFTFYYYLSYLTPERNPEIQNWGDGNQILLQFHGTLNPVYHNGIATSEVYTTYFYYVRPETFQAVEYIMVSTSNPSDAIIDGHVTDPSILNFAKRLEWADTSYTLFQFESLNQIPADLKPVEARLAFRATYCSGAAKNALGRWTCKNSDPFLNVNYHTFIGEDTKHTAPADLAGHSEIFFCFNPKIGGDCKDHTRKGPVPIGSDTVFVFWKADQLSRDIFEFDKKRKPEIHLYFEDSWVGKGPQEYQWHDGDMRLWYPDQFPGDTDPSILLGNKLVLGIEIFRTEFTEKIDFNSGRLNITINVAPKGSSQNDALGFGEDNKISSPTIQVLTNPKLDGPISSSLVTIPAWGYTLIALGSTAFVLITAAIIFCFVKRPRKRKYIIM